MIPQYEPLYGPEEREAIIRYTDSGGWLTEHEVTRELEAAIAGFVGAKHCVMMPNCTLALYAALHCLGVGPGDEVVVPAFTMIATANAIRMTGAEPVFVDIAADNLCIDLCLLEDRISDRTKAVIAVDLNGRAPDLKEMACNVHGHYLDLIEDAAQAFGSRWFGRPLGTFGVAGCYSFGPLKTISAGQGGCAVTDDDDLAEHLRMFKSFGRQKEGADDYETFGINLRYTDLQAAVGLEQFKKLPGRIRRKKEMFALYRSLLAGVDGARFVPTDLGQTCPWFVDVLCEDRDGLHEHLKVRGIGSRKFYPPLHKTPVYAEHSDESFPVAEQVSAEGLWLPSALTLTDRDIETVCQAVREFCG